MFELVLYANGLGAVCDCGEATVYRVVELDTGDLVDRVCHPCAIVLEENGVEFDGP